MFKKRKKEKSSKEMNVEELRIRLKELNEKEAKEATEPPSKIPSVVGLSRLSIIDSIVKLVKEGDKEAEKLVQELLDDENRQVRLWAFFVFSKEIENLKKIDKKTFAKFEEFMNNPANGGIVKFVSMSLGALEFGTELHEFEKKSRANAKLVKKWYKGLDKLAEKWNKKPKREPDIEDEEWMKYPINIELMKKMGRM